MKVLIAAEAESAHTQKWVNGLVQQGIDVAVFSLFPFANAQFLTDKVYSASIFDNTERRSKTSFSKVSYLLALHKLKSIIKDFKPDILHSFYASSYGLLGALSGFRPYCISVLGTDVVEFPNLNIVANKVLRYSLRRTDAIFVTSSFLYRVSKEYTTTPPVIIPFGIDVNVFSPAGKTENDIVTIGTLKNLEPHYSIDILIKAFAVLVNREGNSNLRLRIGGAGSQLENLITLSDNLGVAKFTEFSGFVPYKDAPAFHNSLDIHITPSARETFGVSILEASACGVPVIASDIEGFNDTLKNDVTGLTFQCGKVEDLVLKMKLLISNRELRTKLGMQGRQFVEDNFRLEDNLKKLIKNYEDLSGKYVRD